MAARDKAMNTWSKGKGVKDQVSDDEESGKDEETSMASKVRRKRRRTSEALQFLQVRSEKEAEARKEEISFKKEMAEKEAEARREDIAHKREMASLIIYEFKVFSYIAKKPLYGYPNITHGFIKRPHLWGQWVVTVGTHQMWSKRIRRISINAKNVSSRCYCPL